MARPALLPRTRAGGAVSPPREAGVLVAGVAALAAGGIAAGLQLERRLVTRTLEERQEGERGEHEAVPFFSLRAPGPVVVTPDGVRLHTEVDELPAGPGPADLTVVLVHGYALSLDCWHFQRLHLRGRYRLVLYDQRSHGRSGRSDVAHCRVPQLAEDLAQVLEEVAGPGPLVLVGHSMGGMTIMHLAQDRPELFGDRVRGVALFSTAAGELADYSPIRGLPGRVFSRAAPPLLAALNRFPQLVERDRRAGSDLSHVVTRRMSFGSDVPSRYVAFMSDMLAQTSVGVVADFYPGFAELDEYEAFAVLSTVETAVVGGEDDVITPVTHTDAIVALLPDADTRRLARCGHMGILEHHTVFNQVLDDLVERVHRRYG
ncbi:Pimeloyl-ACP methyl ester carboxylesterase [Friedmanniella luteola]|uniref:Pimeloyl-ACP methyl ester carboxylesterase n=1 Tax=Friedmanniella luteola TaxID=546871 RepID=A0A1H1YVH6_9ACTN|nr:alpha/beta hydrolase [Friedmanniella luteola]SDT25372.1 Pimeloyl-ACP methyl ester carboxylesterase [Friedmanniella luteola]